MSTNEHESEVLDRRLSLAVTPGDLERVRRLTAGRPLRRAALARAALRIGLEQLETRGLAALDRQNHQEGT